MKKEGKKQFVIIGMIFLLLCIELSGCTSNSNDKEKFVGKWIDAMGNSITFTSDGTYSSDLWVFGIPGNWDIRDGKLVFEYTYMGSKSGTTYGYSLSNNNNELAILSSSGYQYQFTKQTI